MRLVEKTLTRGDLRPPTDGESEKWPFRKQKQQKRAQMISCFYVLIAPIYKSPFFRTPCEKQRGK